MLLSVYSVIWRIFLYIIQGQELVFVKMDINWALAYAIKYVEMELLIILFVMMEIWSMETDAVKFVQFKVILLANLSQMVPLLHLNALI